MQHIYISFAYSKFSPKPIQRFTASKQEDVQHKIDFKLIFCMKKSTT
jgi:hypothetical protein